MNLTEAFALLPDTNKNVVVVLSGGLDSSIMTHLAVEKYGKERVFALSFFYGQKQKLELTRAQETCSMLDIKHKILDLSILGDIVKDVSANIAGSDVKMPTIKDVLGDPQPKTYVPFRNMILNALAFSFAESNDASHVLCGLQIHDEYGYWDTTQRFVEAMNSVAAQNRQHQLTLCAPFAVLSKQEEIDIAVQIALKRDINPNRIFEKTLTCYDPNAAGESCGYCPSCSERIANFMKSSWQKDPIPYQIPINWPST